MDDDGRHGNSRGRRRLVLVGVAVGLVVVPVAMGVLMTVLLTSSSASGGNADPTLSSTLAGYAGSATCPSTNKAHVDSGREGSGSALVPPGARAVLLCRYGPDGKRVRETSITKPSTSSQLGWELNDLRSAKGALSCPSDDGETMTADFSYETGAENPVSIGLSGCQTVTNGHVTRLGASYPVIQQLERLAPWVGTIRGRVQMCGGPYPSRCSTGTPGACVNGRCFTANQVSIEHSLGAQYPSVRVRNGRFNMAVEPGRYRLLLLGNGRRVHGKLLDRVSVRVGNDRVTHVVLKIPFL